MTQDLAAKIEKLPKWAQAELALRARRIAELQKQIVANAGKPSRITAIGMNPVGHFDGLPVQAPSGIRFNLSAAGDERRYVDVSIQTDIKTGTHSVKVHGSGSLSLFPHVSNVVHIEAQQW